MIFVFGWGHITSKKYQQQDKTTCDHCNNTEVWTLEKRTSWITLFFIPVIPTRVQRIHYCPICTYGVEMPKEEFEALTAELAS